MPHPLARDSKEPLPFKEIWAPFVLGAREKLLEKKIDSHPDLERWLLKQIAEEASITMGMRFEHYLAAVSPLSMILQPKAKPARPSRKFYRRFVEEMRGGGLQKFFKAYPVLKRLIETLANQWLEMSAEFFRRLEKDRASIERLFNGGKNLGELIQIRTGLSDPHQKGRTVFALKFSSGLRLIYKPKSLSTDEAFYGLLGWINRRKRLLPMKILKVLNCGNYGWIEYVEPLPCRNQEEVSRYYHRCGILLGLLHLLHGVDCHFENLFACGEYPVWIDTETLIQPRLRNWDRRRSRLSAEALAEKALEESAMQTGMLPHWIEGREGKSFDLSGLGCVENQATGYKRLHLIHLNTDQMRLVEMELPPKKNWTGPRLRDQKLTVQNYSGELIAGFQESIRFVLKERRQLLKKNGPLAPFRRCQIRYVLRQTTFYALMKFWLRHVDFLANAVSRSRELKKLKHFLSLPQWKPVKRRMLSIVEAERRSMERGDIPYFTARTDQDSLFANGKKIFPHFFEEPPFKRMLSRVSSFKETDLLFQKDIIYASLHSRFGAPDKQNGAVRKIKLPHFSTLRPLPKGALIAEAEKLATEIEMRAVRRKGEASWITFSYDAFLDRLQLEPMDDSLYAGRCGPALFFAALAKATGNRRYRELALAALQPLRRTCANPAARRALIHKLGLGAGSGLGGLIYTLTRAALWLGEEKLIQGAALLVSTLSQRDIDEDSWYDANLGAAGAILGLIPFAAAVKEPSEALEKAIACGNALLKKRVKSPSGYRAWAIPMLGSQPMTGFAHGASGISLALLRLYQATQEKKFLDAAEEAIACEDADFSSGKQNWPDLREAIQKKQKLKIFKANWCYGAAGIGLARLGGLEVLDTPQIRRDIDAALRTSRRCALENPDHLCCGNLGRVELLLTASQKLNRPELFLEAEHKAAWVIERARKMETYALFAALSDKIFSPSFFQGMSGIGYELLRLAAPQTFPSVLLWE